MRKLISTCFRGMHPAIVEYEGLVMAQLTLIRT